MVTTQILAVVAAEARSMSQECCDSLRLKIKYWADTEGTRANTYYSIKSDIIEFK
jgi:hypothetical protein